MSVLPKFKYGFNDWKITMGGNTLLNIMTHHIGTEINTVWFYCCDKHRDQWN